jgi:protein O-mannosyl-transferase
MPKNVEITESERRWNSSDATVSLDGNSSSESSNPAFAWASYASLFLVIVTFLAYRDVAKHEFTNLDDDVFVFANWYVQQGITLEGLQWAFKTGLNGMWHPLTWLSLMLDGQLFGIHAGSFHLTNLWLHIGNVLLVFWLACRLFRKVGVATVIASLFALHPVNVESVAWIAERKGLLCSFFMLATLVSYLRYVRNRSLSSYTFTLALFLCALFSKAMAITTPLLLLLLDYWPDLRSEITEKAILTTRGQSWPNRLIGSISVFALIEKLPFFFFSACCSVLTHNVEAAAGAITPMPAGYALANVIASYWQFMQNLLIPARLSPAYMAPFYWDGAVIVGKLALLLIATWLVYRWPNRTQRTYIALGTLWMIVVLAPVSGIIRNGPHWFANRYAYVPMLGPICLLVFAARYCLRTSHARVVLSVSTIAVLTVLTRHHVKHWRDPASLWAYALKCTPDNYVASANMGAYLLTVGRIDEAFPHLQKTISENPSMALGYINLSIYSHLKKKLKREQAYCLAGLSACSDSKHLYLHLGQVMARRGEDQRAFYYLSSALSLDPEYGPAHSALAVLLARSHDDSIRDREAALEEADKASRYSDGLQEAYVRRLALKKQ